MMEVSGVKSLKMMMVGVPDYIHSVRFFFDEVVEDCDPTLFWNLPSDSFGKGLIEYAMTHLETRCDIWLEPGYARWIFSQGRSDSVLVKLIMLNENRLVADPEHTGKVYMAFDCDLMSLIDAYRFMFKQGLDDFGTETVNDFFNNSFNWDEIKALDKIAKS